MASCERASINVFLPSNRAHQYSFDAITLYTSCAPALLLCIDLVIPRSPSLSTHSPFTYSISAEHKQTSLEESASLLSLITFSWTVPTMMSVIQQVQMQIYEIVMPYLHARNRSYNLYHAWKLSCASSLRGDLPANPKEEALGRCPKRVNAVLWRIVQANRSAFIVVWTFDIFLASARNLPALTVKHFLIELDAIEVRGTSKYAWAWLIIMVGSIAFRTLLTAADYFRWNARLQSRTRSAIATLVFERALLVSPCTIPAC